MKIEVWLYGGSYLSLQRGGGKSKSFSSRPNLEVREGTTIESLLQTLEMPTEKRSITFVNGNLSALPDLQPDLDQVLLDGDRISFFDLRSMWPFQYRHGAAMSRGAKRGSKPIRIDHAPSAKRRQQMTSPKIVLISALRALLMIWQVRVVATELYFEYLINSKLFKI